MEPRPRAISIMVVWVVKSLWINLLISEEHLRPVSAEEANSWLFFPNEVDTSFLESASGCLLTFMMEPAE